MRALRPEPRWRRRQRLLDWQLLSLDQRALVDRADRGDSFFITGGAGTGKSKILQVIIARLLAGGGRRAEEAIGVVAPTGAAAVQIRGTTVHRFASIPVDKHLDLSKLRDQLLLPARAALRQRLRRLRTLIIDEISMVGTQLFTALDVTCRVTRGAANLPFGGLQVILCGDFAQLPPIDDTYCFLSESWAQLAPDVVQLQYTHRQAEDDDFATLLNEIRRGECSPETERLLSGYVHVPLPAQSSPTMVTHLFPRQDDVDRLNAEQLARLAPGVPPTEFVAEDQGDDRLLKTIRLPARLLLKRGAQVMLLANLDDRGGLVNGTMGRVVGFAAEAPHYPRVHFPTASLRHRTHPMIIEPVTQSQVVQGRILASRRQVPLMLGYAFTQHKAQGLTLRNTLVADLGARVFAPGQAYVTLSRIQSLKQLRLTHFSRSAIKADPAVREWLIAHAPTPILLPWRPAIRPTPLATTVGVPAAGKSSSAIATSSNATST